MEKEGFIQMTRMDMLALVLVGSCELVVFDMFANFFNTIELGSNTIFMLITFVVAFISMAILGFCVMRLREYYGGTIMGGAKAGAFVGFLSGIGIWIVVLLAALAGFGLEKLIPSMSAAWHVDRLGAYLIFFLALVAGYGICGIILGAVSAIQKKL